MPPASASASPAPGSSRAPGGRDRIAEALYTWCRQNYDAGYVFGQDELLDAGIIPDKKVDILLNATRYLVSKSLFKVHDRSNGTIGWELVEEQRAKNHAGLSRDESMVYGAIENAGAAGIWTKTLKARIGNHQNVLERSCKSLQARGLIQPMKSVKFPGRKMFILAGVQPNEEATGGAWFADGTLDVGLLDVISQVVEVFVAKESWEEIDTSTYLDEPLSPPTKRKAPVDGFDDGGEPRSKATRTDDGQQKSKPPKKKYQPYPAGYMDYPTVTQISTHVLDKKVTGTTLPQTAIAQLLDVMVYDDKLLKVYRRPRDNEEADHGEDVTMYRCLRTPNALIERHQFAKRKNSHNPHDRKAAARQQELEEIGRGGSSEVPCMRCPVFDICRDGGPVNALTCKYFDEWFLQVEQADKEAGVGQHASDIKPKSTSNRNRDKERAAVTNGEAKLKVQLENLEPS